MKLAAAVAALLACGRSEPKATVEPSPPAPAAVSVDARPNAAVESPAPTGSGATPLTRRATELVTAVVDDWTSKRATLRRWKRSSAGAWAADGEPWPGVVGTAGTAWGAGLHGTGAPSGRDGPIKREGDGKSPAGLFALRGSYGYAKAAPAGTRLGYTQVDPSWKCVDDPASRHYDTILDERTLAPDWQSAEEMRRKDELYTWVVDVAHNPGHTPGAGSCIFLHVWRGESSATVGCTAMAQDRLAKLVATLDPSALYVLLPRAEYDALAERWDLPR